MLLIKNGDKVKLEFYRAIAFALYQPWKRLTKDLCPKIDYLFRRSTSNVHLARIPSIRRDTIYVDALFIHCAIVLF